MSESIQSRILAPEVFLESLARPDYAVEISLFGHTSVSMEWRVPVRRIKEHLIYLVTNNACEGRVGNDIFRLEPGDFSWIMAGAEHEAWVAKGSRPFKLYFFRLMIANRTGAPLRLEADHIIRRNAWSLRTPMAEIVDLCQLKRPYHRQHIRGLLTVLFSRVLQGSLAHEIDGTSFTETQRQRILQYVRDHVAEWPAPKDLAAELHLSPDYFSRCFRRTFSLSPRRWLLNERIRLAAIRLSEPGLSVSEVAYEFGYGDVYLFSRQFKQVMNISPRFYRKNSGL
jgi:AraC-like DNA-binding protein